MNDETNSQNGRGKKEGQKWKRKIAQKGTEEEKEHHQQLVYLYITKSCDDSKSILTLASMDLLRLSDDDVGEVGLLI